jgi:hypothetical protein
MNIRAVLHEVVQKSHECNFIRYLGDHKWVIMNHESFLLGIICKNIIGLFFYSTVR